MLEILNFTKTYPNGKRAVDNLTLSVESGDIFGFIGRNGAGKTTTIRAVCGILSFDEGEIMIDGHSVRREPMKAKEVTAYVPDNPDLYDYLTGMQYLNFIADIYRVPLEERRKRYDKFGEMLDMRDDYGGLISSYSHGMKQKLSLIAALVHSPKLMVLDEPFVGLDPIATHMLKELMKVMCGEGCAFFFSTHVLDTAEKLCNKIAVIRQGKLVASGGMDEVRGNSSLEEVFMELSNEN